MSDLIVNFTCTKVSYNKSERDHPMVTIEVPAKLTVDDLVTAVSQLPNPELATFLQRVVAIQTQREMFQPGTENEQALVKTIQKATLN